MIIDIHSHLAYQPIYPNNFLSDMFFGLNEKESQLLKKVLPVFLKDKDGKIFLNQMDEVGIEKSFLQIIDGGIGICEAAISIEEIFKLHYEILKKNPSRFVVFAGIDPRRGEKGFNLFKKSICEYGFRGLKLYPPMGYSLEDPILIPYMQICEKFNLPVLVHTGNSLSYLANEYARPENIYSLMNKFKDVYFILAHAGNNLNENIIKMLKDHKKLYVDIAGLKINAGVKDDEIKKVFKLFIDNDILNKVMYGSDWPLFNLFTPIKNSIERIRKIITDLGPPEESDAMFELIMYKNALTILSSEEKVS